MHTTFWDVITVLCGLKEIHPCPKTPTNIYQFVQCHIQEGGNFNVYCIGIIHAALYIVHYLAISCGNEDIKSFLVPCNHTESMDN